MSPPVCGERWDAPRNDVAKSMPVVHVCMLPRHPYGRHRCACGAEQR